MKTLYWGITVTVCNIIIGEFTYVMGDDVIRSNITSSTLMMCHGEKGKLEDYILDTLKEVEWLYGGPGDPDNPWGALTIETRTGGLLKNNTFERLSEPPPPKGLEGPYIYTDSKVKFATVCSPLGLLTDTHHQGPTATLEVIEQFDKDHTKWYLTVKVTECNKMVVDMTMGMTITADNFESTHMVCQHAEITSMEKDLSGILSTADSMEKDIYGGLNAVKHEDSLYNSLQEI